MDRPKDGHHRAVTARRLRHIISTLYGFAVNILRRTDITSLSQLIRKDIVGRNVEWCINERQVKGESLRLNLSLLPTALRHHPSHASLDISWFKLLLDSIPTEDEAQLKRRKAEKYLEYSVVEAIPANIRAERAAARKKGIDHVARRATEELLMRWIITLPWRQRNIRECRIGGPKPNLFKGTIPPFSNIDKPEWVKQEEQRNPSAEFWQFRFSKDETKTGIEVHALLPRQLIGPVGEYLREFRPQLVRGTDPITLFVGSAGQSMSQALMTRTVSDLILRHAGRRVTPHIFRDIVAFTWLKEHPKDYLTVSKMLWHSDIKTTIDTYGSRFNESSGVSAMESWLDGREAKSK